jgi:hypothetical protein
MAVTHKAGSTASDFSNIPDGEYSLKVIDAKEGLSKKGNPMITVRFEVSDNFQKVGTVVDYLTFSESTHWRVNQFLKGCGKHPGDGEDVEMDSDEMIGWETDAQLKIGTGSDGKKRATVAEYLFDK